MASRLTLWVDTLTQSLVSGWRGLVSAHEPKFTIGSDLEICVRRVRKPTIASGEVVEVPFASNDEVAVYLGDRAGRPYDGKWHLTFNGTSTEFMGWNASASDVEKALNLTSTVSSVGGVSVVQLNRDIYKISFLIKGARSSFTGSGVSLFPSSSVIVGVAQEGSPTQYAVFTVMLRQTALAALTTMVPEQACQAAVLQVKPDIWDVYLTSDAKDGYFTMSIDGGEPFSVSVFEQGESLQTKLGAGFAAMRSGDFRWRIVKSNGSSFTASIGSSSKIISFSGVVGTIKIDSQEALEFLSGRAYSDTTIEVVQVFENGRETLVQSRCRLQNKIYE